jgi:hypothetical protein
MYTPFAMAGEEYTELGEPVPQQGSRIAALATIWTSRFSSVPYEYLLQVRGP